MKQSQSNSAAFRIALRGTCFLGLSSLAMAQGPTITARQHIGPTAAQRAILSHMSIVYLPDGQGGLNKTIRIEGLNMQIVNGLGATNGYPADPHVLSGINVQTNGLGNLIIGYDEQRVALEPAAPKTGSHNIVGGVANAWSSWGGQVSGYQNTVSAPLALALSGQFARSEGLHGATIAGNTNLSSAGSALAAGGQGNQVLSDASVCAGGTGNRTDSTSHAVAAIGGADNVVFGAFGNVLGGSDHITGDYWYVVVCGGESNSATADLCGVYGGSDNLSDNFFNHANVFGGWRNEAHYYGASVVGGTLGFAERSYATVVGGQGNRGSGMDAFVAGGVENKAFSIGTSVSGGLRNVAGNSTTPDVESFAFASGGIVNGASGRHSTVTGGTFCNAAAIYSSVSGGYANGASGGASTVSGGQSRFVLGSNDWAAGALFETN